MQYSEPKDMLKRHKIGAGKQGAAKVLATLILLAGVLSPAKLHAEDRHVATAQLHIQVYVVPTLVAAQQARQVTQQPSQSPITFNLEQSTTEKSSSQKQIMTVVEPNGSKQVAVLETRTTVVE